MAFFCYVYYHGLFLSCLGWCGCWAFFVISICTELLCFGRGIWTTCSWIIVFGRFGRIWYETHPDWLATEEAPAVEAVLWWCRAAAAAEAAQWSVLLDLVAGLVFHLSCVCCPRPIMWELMEGFQSQWGWVHSRHNCWNCCPLQPGWN